MKRSLLLITGLLFLLATEILRVYFIMPFPGSQRSGTIQIAYFISKYIWWFRVIGLLLFLPPAVYVFRNSKWWRKILLTLFVLLYGFIFYMFNFKFLADKMFYQPKHKILAGVAQNKVDSNKLVIGVTVNGQSKAYPIEIIGYHHQVQDSIGGVPVMVTYCTVCRTGRVFSPVVNGRPEKFRLVGMDHFNAMFEDATTKSWWRQATGIAVAGSLKGAALKEMASEQMSLGAWIRKNPGTLILQPDEFFAKQYKGLEGFDNGTINSGLEKRDSASWKFKSWVVGISINGHAKAYDWNELLKQRMINDRLGDTDLVLVLENDNRSFHVWNRKLNGRLMEFSFDTASQILQDKETNSAWDMNGVCVEGASKGAKLVSLQAYQEFWHSWQSFHPATVK